MRAWGALVIGVGLLAFGCRASPPASPGAPAAVREAIPHPDLGQVEPSVAAQIETARQGLEASQAAETDRGTWGRAAGELGRLYHVYDFLDAARVCYGRAREGLPQDPTWSYLAGLVEEEEGHLEAAAAIWRQALGLAPDDPAIRVRLASVLVGLGAGAEARELLEGVEDERYAGVRAYWLGRLALDAGDAAGARDHLLQALALRPGANLVHHALGTAYRRLGDADRAARHLAQAGRVAVGFPDPRREALQGLAVGRSASLRSGSRSLFAGRLEDAVLELSRSVAERPGDAEARLLLASALAAQGRRAAALEELSAAARLAPDSAYVRYTAGAQLIALGRPGEGETHLLRALELEPEHLEARLALGELAATRGDHRQALAHYAAARAIDPYGPEPRWREAASQLASGRVEEAMAAARDLLTDRPDAVRAHGVLAEGAGAEGGPSAALEVLDVALERQWSAADEAFLRAASARWLERSGDAATAVEAWRRAVELAPERPALRLELVEALSGRAGWAEAADHLEHLVTTVPGEERYLTLWLEALAEARRWEQLGSALRAAVAGNPEGLPLRREAARFFASCPDPEWRDGALAVALARQVFEADPSGLHGEILAMALAEDGQWEAAVSWQRRALEAAAVASLPELEARLRANLRLYEGGRPCCAKPRGPGG